LIVFLFQALRARRALRDAHGAAAEHPGKPRVHGGNHVRDLQRAGPVHCRAGDDRTTKKDRSHVFEELFVVSPRTSEAPSPTHTHLPSFFFTVPLFKPSVHSEACGFAICSYSDTVHVSTLHFTGGAGLGSVVDLERREGAELDRHGGGLGRRSDARDSRGRRVRAREEEEEEGGMGRWKMYGMTRVR